MNSIMVEKNPFTIVMVEDDLGHALLIEKNLRRFGVVNAIHHCEDGQTAIDYFFDNGKVRNISDQTLILLDLNLPIRDGFEVLEMLKKNEKTRKIPIIILTTTSNPREVDRCYQLGCNIYITKPVDYQSFTAALEKLGVLLDVVKLPLTPDAS